MLLRTALLAVLLAAAVAQDSTVIAITGAAVFDGTGAPPQPATVLIRGQRIEAVGPDLAIPAGARVVKADGQTLLPGLFDMHTHLWANAIAGQQTADIGKHLKAYLYSGVTTVVDFSSDAEQFEPLRRLTGNGTMPSPRLLLASRVTTPGGHGSEGGWSDLHTQEIRTPEEARAAVRRVAPYQPDVIKAFTDGWRYGTGLDLTDMDQETLAAVVEEAHKHGMRVLTHTVTLEKAKVAARAGVDSLVHGIGNAAVDEELANLMKEKGTGYASTLAVYEQHGPQSDDLLQAVLPQPGRARALRAGPAPILSEARARRWNNLMGNIRRLKEASARFGLGTDAGMGGTYHGWATLRELKLLVAGGLTPLEALSAGTLGSARLLGVDSERGTIAAGKLADLLLVEGAPHKNIGDIDKVRTVFLGGREIDRAALARDIASPEPTRLAATKPGELIDDFEKEDDRTALDTRWSNGTDGGHDKSEMVWRRIARESGGHALSAMAKLAVKQRPSVRVQVPLRRGGVEPADVRDYAGVQFDLRGEGTVEWAARSLRGSFTAPVDLAKSWKTVRVPFASLKPRGSLTWQGDDLTQLVWQVSGRGGETVWLELDNVRFYR